MATSMVLFALGLSLLAAGLGIATNPKFYEKAIREMVENKGVFFLGSIMTLIVGFLLADYEGGGNWNWVINIFGYLSVLKGLALLIVPKESMSLSLSVINGTGSMKIISYAVLLLSVIFLILGFES